MIISDSNVLHQGTPLEIDEHGNIIGLPKKFGESKFDLDKNYLKINDKEIVFPYCLSYYFDIHEKPELNLFASWYHSKDIMPHYLHFDIFQKNGNFGYAILINLETLELINVQICIIQDNTIYSHEIKLEDYCLDEYRKGIKVLKK